MNKDQLASVVAAEVGLSQTDAKQAVEAVFNGITNGMKNGDKEISIFYTLKLCGLPMFPRGFFKIPSPLY